MRLHTNQSLRFINEVRRALERAFEADSKQNDSIHLHLYLLKIWHCLSKRLPLSPVGQIPVFVQRDSILILGGV